MKQLVACDLDGTLLNHQGELTQRTVQAIKTYLDRGGNFVIATGRPYFFAKRIADQIDSRLHLIAFNGALVKLANSDCQLYPIEIDFEALGNRLLGIKGEAYFKSLDHIYSWQAKSDFFKYPQAMIDTSIIETFRFDEPILKILFYSDDESEVTRIKNQINQVGVFTKTDYGQVGFELVAVNRNKGIALEEIMKRLQIDRREVVAIGDSHNDMDLLRVATVKVAVANAKPDLLVVANKTIAHHSADGVAIYLEELMKERG